jgi:hypothetical protein
VLGLPLNAEGPLNLRDDVATLFPAVWRKYLLATVPPRTSTTRSKNEYLPTQIHNQQKKKINAKNAITERRKLVVIIHHPIKSLNPAAGEPP